MPQHNNKPMATIKRPELLSPAGDWECVRAAVENGADAVYFGLERFNARMRAQNFTVADLTELMEFLHRRGVRGYVTFNTLVFETELDEAKSYLKSIIRAGVDAAIVQDIGMCRVIRNLSPDFPIHGSTQMTVTSAAGIEFARQVGCDLVVLARECSIKELESIQAAQKSNPTKPATPLPLEVFVHGALCVAYSGQCLTSEVLGGRSANRGECAQACRMPYELLSDGAPMDLGDRQYLLSPQDLSGIEVLPELISNRVSSVKIEGRLKTPEYVASITRIYREAIDSTWARLADRKEVDARSMFTQARHDLEMSFSRGLYTGWFRGNNNQALVHARFGKKRGVFLGEVSAVRSGQVEIHLHSKIKPGDGVVFDQGKPEAAEEGGRVYHAAPHGDPAEKKWLISFGYGAVDFNRIHAGDKLWKTSDPEFEKRIRKTYEDGRPQHRRPIVVEAQGEVGTPLTLVVRDELGNRLSMVSDVVLEKAFRSPLSSERMSRQLGRLGGTPFFLESLENKLEGDVILPVSELNRMRREAINRLEKMRAEKIRWTLNPAILSDGSSNVGPSSKDPAPRLVVLVRSMEQLDAAMAGGASLVYCEFENPKGYRNAVASVREFNNKAARANAVEIFVAPPRVFKMGEEWILEQVQSANPDGFLVRNYDHLNYFRHSRMIGDFSFNVANSITANYFKQNFALERLTASYDLNAEQLKALLKAAPPEWFEVTLHQHMPMFHMEHCVFCAFLSDGKDYRDCGRPCDKHEVTLRDRVGMEHPLKADVGCRNTLYNARAQTGAEFYAPLFDSGVRHFRVEFVNESADDVAKTLAMYQSLLAGEVTGADLWRQLKLQNQLGVTRGQMGK